MKVGENIYHENSECNKVGVATSVLDRTDFRQGVLPKIKKDILEWEKGHLIRKTTIVYVPDDRASKHVKQEGLLEMVGKDVGNFSLSKTKYKTEQNYQN